MLSAGSRCGKTQEIWWSAKVSSDSSLEDNLLLADKFKQEIGTVSWSWLRPHEKHKILFLVAAELDLIEVAVAVGAMPRLRLVDDQRAP